MTHVHLIGIGGAGMSAIARVLLESGHTVSGSDRQPSPLAQSLEAAGVRVYTGHRAENVSGAEVVVRSSAVPDDNVEVQAARAQGIPVLKRADFLGRLVEGRQVIAVAGAHGKTTTTTMIAWMLTVLGQDPSYLIGGVSTNLGNNAHAGRGPYFVIEADEYDRMFLGLAPQIAVVTNVEYDHPDCYPTPADYYAAFRQFVGRILPGGVLLACSEDPGAARLLSDSAPAGLEAIGYGIEADRGEGEKGAQTVAEDCQTELKGRTGGYRAYDLALNGVGGYTFSWAPPGSPAIPASHISLQIPGVHNVRNALAALAAAHQLGLDSEAAGRALGEFRGTGRRFELRGEAGGVAVIDDYAHHPTKIRATLEAARARYPGRRLWAVWQPHTYSRTRTLLADFAAAFRASDQVVVTEVFPAREAPPADGFSARQVVEAMEHPQAHFVPSLEEAAGFLLGRLQPGDVVLVLSAGDAERLSAQVLEGLMGKGDPG